MFKLPSTHTNKKTVNGNLPIIKLNTGKHPIKLYKNNSYFQSLSFNSFVDQNNNITISLNQNNLDLIKDVNFLKINNKTYIRDYNNNQSSGTFSINNNNLIVRLSKEYLENKQLIINIKVPIINEDVKEDVVPVLDFCKDWDFYGDISINLNYKSHPTASLTLIADLDNINQIRAYFKDSDNKIVLYSIPFRVTSYVENPKIDTVNDEYNISVELEGYYSFPLSISQSVQSLFNGSTSKSTTTTNIKSSNSPTFNIGSDYNKNFITLTLRELGSRIGIKVTGDDLTARFPKEIGLGSGFVLENIISSRCRDFGKYPVYSNEDSLEIRDWNTGYNTHRLSEKDVLSFTLNDRTIKITVPPTELSWETDYDIRRNELEKSKEFVFPTVVYDPVKQTIVTTPVDITQATNPPSNVKYLETTSLNFDSSGERSTIETTYYEGDSVVKKIVTVYGFAFLTKDILNPITKKPKGNPEQYWQIVSRTETNYLYDDETGYLLGTDTTGWRLGRFSIESDALETSKLTDNDFELQLYQYRRIPIVEKQRFVLKQLGDFYPDENNALDAFLTWDSYDRVGNPIKRYKPNPLYIPKMFVYQQENYYNSFAHLPNPKNQFRNDNTAKFPDYTTGEIKRSIVTNVILQSKNTTQMDVEGLESGFSVDSRDQEDRYLTYTQNFSAQDSAYINNLQIETSEVNSGRPQQHTYKKKPYRISNTGNLILDTNIVQPDINNIRVPKTIIYTSPYKLNHISSSTSYSVRTKTLALNAANTELRENKTFNESSISLETFFNRNFKEGDCILISYRGNDYRTRIRSISHNIKVIDKDLYIGKTSLTLGIESIESYNVYNSSLDYIDLNLPVDKGFTLGSIKDVRDIMTLKNRGNING